MWLKDGGGVGRPGKEKKEHVLDGSDKCEVEHLKEPWWELPAQHNPPVVLVVSKDR